LKPDALSTGQLQDCGGMAKHKYASTNFQYTKYKSDLCVDPYFRI